MVRPKWEHKVRTVSHYADVAISRNSRGDVFEDEDIGDDGWELVSVLYVPTNMTWAAFFKRPVVQVITVTQPPTYEARDDD